MSNTPTVPSPSQVLADPHFQGLPSDQQKIVLGKIDPNFAGLAPDQQDLVLNHGKQPDLASNPNGEGTYKMNGPHGQIGVPFSNVVPAQHTGYKLDPTDHDRFIHDYAYAPADNGDSGLTVGGTLSSTLHNAGSAILGLGKLATHAAYDPVGAGMDMGESIASSEKVAGKQTAQYARDTVDPNQGGVLARGLNAARTATSALSMVNPLNPAGSAGMNAAIDAGDPDEALGQGIVQGAAFAMPAVAGAVANKARSILTGGTKAASDLNASTLADNASATEDAATKNAKIQSDRTKALNDHFQAIQQAKGEAPTTVGILPDSNGAPRPMNARELASHKEALNAGVQQLDQQFKSDLISTAKDAKTQLDNKYDTVRSALEAKTDPETGEITPAPSVPSSQLAQSVNNAEAKLMGSSENIKQFKDIISKHPDSDPDFVTDKTPGKNNLGTVPRGNPLYDIIQDSQGGAEGPGATFRDLQGYYTELGDKLSSGGLQGDVYQAMKSLHDDIGGMMKKMAADNGVGSQLADAQDYARNYYADWRDPASPLYNAIKKAPERGDSIAHFQGADQSGIGTLAKYNPELAKRANTIRGYQQQADSISSKPFVEKTSALAPSTPPVQADVKTIGPEDIQGANAAELANRTAAIRRTVNKAALYVTGYRSLAAVGRALSGDVGALSALPADVGEGMALAAGGNGLASLLESPKVSQYLTKPTPAQVATIDPSIARDLAPIVQAAKTKGIRVSPALAAAISAHATKDKWWDSPDR